MNPSFLEKVRMQIAEAELEEAFNILKENYSFFNKDQKNQIIQFNNRFNNLNREYFNLDIIPESTYRKNYNKLLFELLNFLSETEGNNELLNNLKKESDVASEGNLRLLVVAQSPNRSNILRVKKEISLIKELFLKFKVHNDIDLKILEKEKYSTNLFELLYKNHPEIIHLISHGKQGHGLVLESLDGKELKENTIFLFKFADYIQKSNRRKPKLFFCAAPHSYQFASLIVENQIAEFSLGINGNISAEEIYSFTKLFYINLFKSKSLVEALTLTDFKQISPLIEILS